MGNPKCCQGTAGVRNQEIFWLDFGQAAATLGISFFGKQPTAASQLAENSPGQPFNRIGGQSLNHF
jgi:hypothetical protein